MVEESLHEKYFSIFESLIISEGSLISSRIIVA
jgi:hypothetical protein